MIRSILGCAVALPLLVPLSTPSAAQEVGYTPEAARPLSNTELANYSAFARVLGLVRHFHPSDASYKADWEAVALLGARRVGGCASPEELSLALVECFREVAPTMSVFPTGSEPPALHDALKRPDTEERILMTKWFHSGYGQEGYGEETAYTSRRSQKKLKGDGFPKGYVDPLEPYTQELPGGVTCRVPLTLYLDEFTRTRPHVDEELTRRFEVPANELTPNDRSMRIGTVAILWNVLQHFYPYFDVVDVDWPAQLEVALRRAAEDHDSLEFLETLQLLLASMQDGHARVHHDDEGIHGYLPLRAEWIDDELVVFNTDGTGPPSLDAGDVILSIDGEPVAERRARFERLRVGATKQWTEHAALWLIMSGERGAMTEVEFRDHQADGELKKAEIEFGKWNERAQARREQIIEELEPGIWYVDLTRISDEQFTEALPALTEAKGLVFEMRGYPSLSPRTLFPHIANETVESARWNVPVVKRPNQEDVGFRTSHWTIKAKEPYLSAPKAFITNGRAISYAESCMGIVEHYSLGEIVGRTTAGTNGNVNYLNVLDYRVNWTGMQVLKNDGSRHHGVGIAPTIPMRPTLDAVRAGRDLALEAAVEAVKQ